jgi:beta-aspartyl-peptidase (threonine type)
MRAPTPLYLLLPFLLAVSGRPTGPQPETPSQQQQTERFQAEVQESVKHTLVSQIEAWNHGNLERFMQGYWHSPELTFFSADGITKGWEPTLQRYRKRYRGEGRQMGQLDFQDLDIDVLSRRAAVVTGKWQLTMPDGTKPHGVFTLVVKKMPGGWKIIHDHTSAAP